MKPKEEMKKSRGSQKRDRIQELKKKRLQLDNLVEKFSKKVFEIIPEMLGLTISTVRKPSKFSRLPYPLIDGLFIENKNRKIKRKKNEV